MNILVTAASRHGSTWGIAEVVAQVLSDAGGTVNLQDIEEVENVASYDAAVIGSAVYVSGWIPEAREFVSDNAAALVTIPVWLFSSGRLGDQDHVSYVDPVLVTEVMAETGAVEHREFAGELNFAKLGVVERLVAKGIHAPEGDYRDWEAIAAWARTIADRLNLGANRDGAKSNAPDL